MTSNAAGKTGNVVYASGNNASTGRKRVAVSATEIEFLNDIPPSVQSEKTNSRDSASVKARRLDTQTSSSSMDKQNQQNSYQTLSANRKQPQSNVIYQNEINQQLNSAVDKLLYRYAPDATPQNVSNTSNDRRQPTQVKIVRAGDEQPFSTFQTSAPSSSSTTSHNYSTIIRTNTGQTPQTQTTVNPYNNINSQQNTRTRPVTSYDSFQHAIPPPQQQQQQQQQQQRQQSQTSVSVKTKNGTVAQVVPGKLYNLNDDPLYTLYDKQTSVTSTTQKSSIVTTTFQPSTNTYTVTDPLSILFTRATQKAPQQSKLPPPPPTTTTTADANSNGVPSFDLGNLIKRVQQDYLHEVQPFVTSVKFVEKDTEYGQTLSDIDFTTPVKIEKGFTRQADDILRRSFGRQDGKRQPSNDDDDDDSYYSDNDDVDELRPSNRYNPLEKIDSKQSFTSVTSVSTSTTDYGGNYSSANNNKNKVQVHNQSTSPPPKFNQTTTQPQQRNPPAASIAIPPYLATKNESYEKETTTSHPGALKLAQRVSSSQVSVTSSESVTSNDQEGYPPKYNEPEPPESSRSNPSRALQAIVANTAIVKPVDEPTRGPINTGNQAPQRSEEINPKGPIIRTTHLLNPETQIRKSESEDSDVIGSASDNVSESEDEDKSAIYNQQPQASSTARYNAQQVTTTVPAGRDATVPSANARDAAASGRNATVPPTDARDAVASGRDTTVPPTIARDAVASGRDATVPPANARDAVASGRDATVPPANARDAVASGRDATVPPANARDAVASGRDATIPPANARDAAASGRNTTAPPTNARDAVASGRDATVPPANARDAAASGRNTTAPPTNARDAAASGRNANVPPVNARNAAASGTNPNIPFVPPDQRAAANQPASTGGAAAQTGSTRLFKSDNDSKYGGKRSAKDSSNSLGTRVKNFFRRKK